MLTLHSIKGTQGCFCDGKPCFEVLEHRKSIYNRLSFYCSKKGVHIDPTAINETNCPAINETALVPRYNMKANRWTI